MPAFTMLIATVTYAFWRLKLLSRQKKYMELDGIFEESVSEDASIKSDACMGSYGIEIGIYPEKLSGSINYVVYDTFCLYR